MSEIRLPAPVKATIVEDIDESNVAGAVEIRGTGMAFRCPCGCGLESWLTIRPAPSPSWEWDGNREEPTLSPSVHNVGHWHGFLRAGWWVQA